MSRKSSTPDTTSNTEDETGGREYIERLPDAATTACYKLNVAIQLIRHAEDPDPYNGDDGGWGLSVVVDILRQIQDDLTESIAQEAAERKAEGGAR